MNRRAAEAVQVASARGGGAMTLGSALFLTVLVVIGLSALAFWPAPTWSPPRRPSIAGPIVFDEFVNPSNAAPASSEGLPAAR